MKDGNVEGEAPARGPESLSKPQLDVGFFTNNLEAVLAFWRDEIGLSHEEPVHFNDTLVQYRHALGNTVVKINAAKGGVAAGVPTGYRELLIAREGVRGVQRMQDPDENRITLVPPGYLGVRGIGVRLGVTDLGRQRRYYVQAMGLVEEEPGAFRAGDSLFLVEQNASANAAGHWVNAGFRYVTLHVKRVDASFDAIVKNGAAVGEELYSIGKVARIGFIRDPDGNWIEVAQRAALAGPWWED